MAEKKKVLVCDDEEAIRRKLNYEKDLK